MATLCNSEESFGFDHVEPVFGRWSNGGESRCRSLRRTGAMAYELLLHRARCGRYNISCSLDEDKQRNPGILDR